MARTLCTRALCALTGAALLCMPACAFEPSRTPLTSDAVALLVDAERAQLPIEDPSVMDDDMRRAIDNDIGHGGTPRQRVERLRAWLHDGLHPFVHDPTLTSDARTTYHSRRGGCMAHSVLFVTLARYLGVEAYYVHAVSAREYADRGDGMVALTHVAVGYTDGPNERVIDVWIPVNDWRLVRYDRVDDTSALGLYYSNIAVEHLRAGRLAEAETMLRFLASHANEVAEVRSNLAAVLVRERRFEDALAVTRDGVARFPAFKPLYTNGYLAAEGLGQTELAEAFAAKSRELLDADPIFLVARGVSEFERGQYEQAARSFERARSDKSDSIVIQAWLVRAYVAAGDARSSQEALERAWSLAPNDPRLERLIEEHPELRVTR